VDSGPYLNTPNDATDPIANHLIDPDMSAVQGAIQDHWKTSGDSVVEMTQLEKDTLTSTTNAANAATEAAKTVAFDTLIASQTDESDYVLTRIDNYVDDIDSFVKLRMALKKIMRAMAREHR
jgi:hypothetical protein